MWYASAFASLVLCDVAAVDSTDVALDLFKVLHNRACKRDRNDSPAAWLCRTSPPSDEILYR